MAVFGRRQPHSPIILTGGINQPPIGRYIVHGQRVSQQNRNYYQRTPQPKIIKGGGQPVVGKLIIHGQKVSQASSNKYYHPKFLPITNKLGPAPSKARQILVQRISQLPTRRPKFSTLILPPRVTGSGPPPVLIYPAIYLTATSQRNIMVYGTAQDNIVVTNMSQRTINLTNDAGSNS